MITLTPTQLRDALSEPVGLWCVGCKSYVPQTDVYEDTGTCFVCAFHKLGFPLDCWSVKTQYHPLIARWSTRMNYDDGEYTYEILAGGKTRKESISNAHAETYETVQRDLNLSAGHWGRLCYADDASEHRLGNVYRW